MMKLPLFWSTFYNNWIAKKNTHHKVRPKKNSIVQYKMLIIIQHDNKMNKETIKHISYDNPKPLIFGGTQNEKENLINLYEMLWEYCVVCSIFIIIYLVSQKSRKSI